MVLDRAEADSRALCSELEAAGHSVEHVVDLVVCVTLARLRTFDVILAGTAITSGSSLGLPVVLPHPRPLLLYMTTLQEHGLGRTARRMGFDDVVTKSVGVDDVTRRVRGLGRAPANDVFCRQGVLR